MNTYKKFLTGFIYFLSAVLIFTALIYISQPANLGSFLGGIENKTFDLRQNILLQHKKHRDDIVIIAIDDPSYEYIVDKFGAWPAPRSFWAGMVEGIEKSSPKLIAFDLLFIKRFSAEKASDEKLIKAIASNDNVLVPMDFDNYPPDVRKPAELPDDLKNTVTGDRLIKKNNDLNFSNCRKIMDELLGGTPNVGIINVTRDKDGVIRTFPPMFVYKGDYYKNLSLLAATKYLGITKREFEIKNDALIVDEAHSVPLAKDGTAILNWYGPAETFKYISAYNVNEAIKNNDRKYLDENFKGKVIFIGTTIRSLMDLKTTPVARRQAGVELHATFLNNLLDNSFIKRTNIEVDILIALVMCILTGIGVLRSKSVALSVLAFLVVSFGYLALATYLMYALNLWLGVVLPVSFALIIFISCYIVKYLVIYRDYEHTYKLAVTDGLTNMYNHRYFQEQMIANTNAAKRYKTPYSLILIDIDFFKKFNDTHGHQSGDAVLRQVGQAIKKSVRTTDIPCRYGGEEMAVILPNTGREDAIQAAKKIWQAIEQGKFELATGAKTNVTVSVGVASTPENGENPEELIGYADKCLYKAKQQGRNQVVAEV